MYYDNLTRQYPISKTLRNELIPIGKTMENIRNNRIIESDINRKEDYQKVKKIFDEYHKSVINTSLNNLKLEHLESFADLFFMPSKSEAEIKKMETEQTELRKEIVAALKSHKNYGILQKKEIIQELDKFVNTVEEHEAINSFNAFFTYFSGYNKNRSNLYSDENKASTVAYRLIHENLPRFLNNIKAYTYIKNANITAEGLSEEEIDKLFMLETYNYVLTQDNIDLYNEQIGMLNKEINLYNQKHRQEKRLPMLSILYRQILSERTESFISEFATDSEVLDNLDSLISETNEFLKSDIFALYLNELKESSGNGIYVKNNTDLTSLSVIATESWRVISDLISSDYDANYSGKKIGDKYEEEKDKILKKISSYELKSLIQLGANNLIEKYIEKIEFDVSDICEKTLVFDDMIACHDISKKLSKNVAAVDSIKDVLDSIKTLERDLKLLLGNGDEPDKNYSFYGNLDSVLMEIMRVDELYNMTRNYLTKKPFSTDKIKLNFDRPTFLDGWDRNKEEANLGILLKKDNKYYLGIMNPNSNKVFRSWPEATSFDRYQKVEYKLLPGPNKMLPKVFFADSNIEYYAPSEEILTIRRKESFKKGDSFNLHDCHKLIDFFKESINKHEDWSKFDFKFTETEKYADISEFYHEVEKQGYKITYDDVDSCYIDELIENNKLYLFEIHNKDFSEYSKGNLNLHTIYFEMVFDEHNLSDVVYKLNGEAEVFYRPASISEDEQIVHKAGEPIENKNPLRKSVKKSSIMNYDIIKDKRYTEDKFMLHVPITMNFGASKANKYNDRVNNAIRESKDVHVIGIDRGERNLLYVVVVNSNGDIVEQISLNSIVNKEYKIETNYHELLKSKENERDKARKDWKTIENIKELKEGYLSQVVHVISQLVVKYNAIICLEDLNMGFMRGRQKVERQVYQKFEKMLIDKLNYLVIDKDRNQKEPEKVGGALNALQLTAPFTSFKEMGKQTGIIYYVPAYLTSKIDPTTGFSNLFYEKYKNQESAKAFFGKFERINYNSEDNYFEFAFDYKKFTTKADGTQTKWIACSYGKRIRRFRNEKINNNWDEEEIELTTSFKELFDEYGINYKDSEDLIGDILAIDNAQFFAKLSKMFNLMMQMRNSSNDGMKDYIISPILNEHNEFYDSSKGNAELPIDADANGAYNIARKGLWVLDQLFNSEKDSKVRLAMTNKEWLLYAQEHRK